MLFKFGKLFLTLLLMPELAVAGELNQANTAWVLTSTTLVLFMTIPGLSLFYGGTGQKQKRAVGFDAVFFNYLSGFHALVGRCL